MTEDALLRATQLTHREEDELEVQKLALKRPLEILDTPEKIAKWAASDEYDEGNQIRNE